MRGCSTNTIICFIAVTIVPSIQAQLLGDYSPRSRLQSPWESQRLPRSSSECILTLCEHSDCSGQQLVRNDSDPTLVDDGFNDRVSAVRVSGECQWILYERTDYGGTSDIYGGASSVIDPGDYLNATFGIPDDELSSLRCLPASGVQAIALFQHDQYLGNMRVLYSPSEDLRNFNFEVPQFEDNFDDITSSFLIISGVWQLFSGPSYTGSSVTRGVGHYPTPCHLSPVRNDDLSSVRLGERSDVDVDGCSSSPCQNGGTCQDLINTCDYQCDCAVGWMGRNCQFADCSPNPCQNGGTCFDLTDDYQCNCALGWTGRNCDTAIQFQFLLNATTVDEPDVANTSLRLMVELLLMPNTSVLQSDVVLTVSVLPGSTADEDDDFVLVNSELTFGSGLTGGTQLCVTVNILSDTIVEGNETLTISGSVSPPAVFVSGENTVTITILDYDMSSTGAIVGGIIGGTIAGALAILASVVLFMACLVYLMIRRRNAKDLQALRTRVLGPPSSSHTYQECVHRDMEQFDKHRAKDEMSEEVAGYLQQFPEEMIFDTRNLDLLDSVGQGEFGVVYRARLTRAIPNRASTLSMQRTYEIVAVKTLKGFLDASEVANILRECLKMKKFDHPHVMGILGICLAGQTPYIVMPFMASGSLHSYLRKYRPQLLISEGGDIDLICTTKKRLIDMCLQIAKGMEYLTWHKLVHRDLAARNCMLDQNFVIKVADFGLAESTYTKSYFRQDHNNTGVKLPIKWMAPESLTDGVFSEKTDVWSFGVTCWEIFSAGKTPYPGIHPTSLISQLEGGERLPKPRNASCCDSMYSVMLSCWDADPERRPTFVQLVSTITSVLVPLADYLDVSTFITGNQVVKTNITDSQTAEEEEASRDECQTTVTDSRTVIKIENETAERCIPEDETNLPQTSEKVTDDTDNLESSC